MVEVVTARKAFLAGACAIMFSQVVTGVFNYYDLNEAKRTAFRAGYKQQQIDNTYGMDEYGITYFTNAYTNAEIDSILKARE